MIYRAACVAAVALATILSLALPSSGHVDGHEAAMSPRGCYEDSGICWNALIDGNHIGHYIVGVSDEVMN